MLKENLKEVQENILKACEKSGRNPEDVTLIAVSKTKPVPMLQEIYDENIRDFGENKVQELCDKFEHIKSPVHWHMIGHLQTNKVKYIVDKVSMIHSVNKLSLAEEINKKMEALGKKMPVLIEVNVSGEESKEGYEVLEAEKDLPKLLNLKNISICGLMTMAPFTEDIEEQRRVFQKLRTLKEDWNEKYFQGSLTELSMGMSNDYKIALQEGATMIRLGRKIFY